LSIKRALVFNVIGSVAAYAGFAIGLLLGNDESVRRWEFAAAAGVFLYVAWIDMVDCRILYIYVNLCFSSVAPFERDRSGS
jgi:hypothetical protein